MLNNRGDTIVEVLIAMTIIAMVLAGAFASSRRAQVTSQRNDERSLATKFLETQTEYLSIAASDPFHNVNTTMANGNEWCFQNDAPIDGQGRIIVSTSHCTGVSGLYEIYFRREDTNTYSIHVEWDRLGNTGGTVTRESAEAHYKVYPR
jgi:prepilin-type N-terminal cleavage/methylation domain-containing protein